MNWYIKVLKNCIAFKGRASRKELFFISMFLVFTFDLIIWFLLLFADENVAIVIWILCLLMLAIIFIVAVVRRLHDINRSGWWWFILLFPVVNLYAFGFLLLVGGKSALNQYGSSLEESIEQQPPSLKTLLELLIFCVFFFAFTFIGKEFV